jgi:hypothetical protein
LSWLVGGPLDPELSYYLFDHRDLAKFDAGAPVVTGPQIESCYFATKRSSLDSMKIVVNYHPTSRLKTLHFHVRLDILQQIGRTTEHVFVSRGSPLRFRGGRPGRFQPELTRTGHHHRSASAGTAHDEMATPSPLL